MDDLVVTCGVSGFELLKNLLKTGIRDLRFQEKCYRRRQSGIVR